MTEARTPPKVARPEPAPIVDGPAVERLRARLAAAPDEARRAELLTAFWRETTRTPLIEPAERPDERIVTFLWRDAPEASDALTAPADAVLLFANRVTDERDLDASLMRRLPGTDLWHLSYRMRHDWRASYSFQVRRPGETWSWTPGDQVSIRRALDRGLGDPLNPITCPNRAGTLMSVVELPEAPPQPWRERRAHLAARGTVTRYLGPGRRTVWLYDPPAAPRRRLQPADPTAHPVLARPAGAPPPRLPVVVLFDGEVWAGPQHLADTLDNLIADGLIRPCLVVMPEAGGRDRRWNDLDEDGAGGDWVVHELLPWVRGIAPASTSPDEVIVAGQSLGGYTALRCALAHPEAVGAVLSQSASLWQRELYAQSPALVHRLHAYIEVGAQEWVLREPNRGLAAAFVAAGADVHFVEYNGGHDYACWRGGLADGLRALLGPPVPGGFAEHAGHPGTPAPPDPADAPAPPELPEHPEHPEHPDGGHRD